MSSPVVNRVMTPTQWGMLIGLSIVWGASFFVTGILVERLPTMTVVLCRVLPSALMFWLIVLVTRAPMPMTGPVWRAFLTMGLLNNAIPFIFIVWSQNHIASGLAAIFNATTPLFTVVAAHFLTRDEKMTPARICGVILGLVGVAVMIGGTALEELGVAVAAQLGVLGAALSYALAAIYGRRFVRMGVSPTATATGQLSGSSLILLPIVLWVDEPWALAVPSMETFVYLGVISVICTGLAYLIYFKLLAAAGATNVLIVTFLVPVSAIWLGVMFAGEVLLPKHLLGMGLIGMGLAAIDGRPVRLVRRVFA